MCERGCRASHNEGHDSQNIRPRLLRDREVPWEGSQRSKLMSRRTETPYKVDGADKLAQHSAVRCSAPEINGPVLEREFTFLLRETCHRAPSATAGARVSNDPRALAGVSRGRSTESNEPGNTGRSHNSGRAELGRQNTTIGGLVPGALKPIGRALGSDHRGRERVLLRPQGLPGTAGRGPACPVVWEAGGETPPPTRLGSKGYSPKGRRLMNMLNRCPPFPLPLATPDKSARVVVLVLL